MENETWIFFKALDFWSILSTVISLSALVLYFQSGTICWQIFREGNTLYVWTQNGNRFRRIFDVECEAVLCTNERFELVRTLEFVKNRTLILERPPHKYVFISNPVDVQGRFVNIDEYEWLRLRWVASNAIGVRKFYEAFVRIRNIEPKPAET